MPSVERNSLVPFSAKAMFELVNDVAAYPQFLPGCNDSKVLSVSDTQMKASLQVAKAGIQQWFTTQNQLIEGESIKMELIDGPFNYLHGEWRFVPLSDEACKIELTLNFDFNSKLAELAFGKVFNQLASNMVTAFSQRARVVYGVNL